MATNEPTPSEVLDLLDPDWRTRFAHDLDLATSFYQNYGLDAWLAARAELSGLPLINHRGESFEQFYNRVTAEDREEEDLDEEEKE